MKNRMIEALTIYSKESSPDTIRHQFLQKLSLEHTESFSQDDYLKARDLGLTISEARDAIKLASLLKTEGEERLFKGITPGISLKHIRKNDGEEPALKKKRLL